MFILKHKFYMAPDTGAGGGTGGAEPEETGQDYKAKAEALEAQLKEAQEKIKAAEAEKKEAEKAKMTEAEKKKAEAEELEKMKADTLAEYKSVQLQKAGLSDEYASLITGSTRDEIAASGELIRKLVDSVKTETEAAIKKTVANTGAPGKGDDSQEMDEAAYYASLIKGAINV